MFIFQTSNKRFESGYGYGGNFLRQPSKIPKKGGNSVSFQNQSKILVVRVHFGDEPFNYAWIDFVNKIAHWLDKNKLKILRNILTTKQINR